jgi:hypothetical protein
MVKATTEVQIIIGALRDQQDYELLYQLVAVLEAELVGIMVMILEVAVL